MHLQMMYLACFDLMSSSCRLYRSLRRPHQRHDAPDVQEEKVVVEGRVLEPAEERTGEEVRDPEVRHQAGQKAAGCDARPHGRSGENKPPLLHVDLDVLGVGLDPTCGLNVPIIIHF